MKKTFRFLVLFGTLALLVAPVFADGGPGSGDPLPPGNATPSSSSSAGTIIAILLSYLGL